MDKPIVHVFELAIGLLMLIYCIGFWLNQPYQTEHALKVLEFQNRAPQEVMPINSSGLDHQSNTTLEKYDGNQEELNLIMTGAELSTILSFQSVDGSYKMESHNMKLRNLDMSVERQQDLIYYYKNECIPLTRDEVISKIIEDELYYMTYEMDSSSRIISIRITRSNSKL